MDIRPIADYFYVRIFPWILPPLIGAVIGYVTNDIAIRMLFRPLKEWRIFGVRVPFTPGIIPKRRREMAESIGRMVSRELLTAEAVRRQMASEGFQIRLRQNIDSLLGQILNIPLSALRKGNQELLFSSVEKFLSDALYSFFSSKSFIHGVRTLITQGIQHLSGRRLGELLGQTRLGPAIADRLLSLVAGPETRKKIAQSVRGWIEERRKTSEPWSDLFPAGLVETLSGLAGGLLPSLFDALFSWLDEEGTRAELQVRGKRLLRDVLDKLNLIQKFLISAGQFDRRLEQKMPEIVDDALGSAREYIYKPETIEGLRQATAEALERWRQKPTAEVLSGIGPETVAALVDKALASLENEGLRRRLAAGLERFLEKQKERPIGELLQRYLKLQEQEVIEFACFQVLNYLSRLESSQGIAAEVISFSRRFLEEHQENTARQLLRIDEALQAKASAYLCEQIIRIIDARLPALLESFDVKELVVAKVNQLDVLQMEKLLLMVIAKELKWIVIFGGILGAIIGLAQLALRLLN